MSLLCSKASGLVLEFTQLLIQWMPGAVSLGVKRAGRKTNSSSLSNVDVKYGQAILPLTHVPSFRGLGQLYILVIPTGWLVGGGECFEFPVGRRQLLRHLGTADSLNTVLQAAPTICLTTAARLVITGI